MPRIMIEAPAKINLHLRVGDRRPDGIHDIESLFLALAFGDTLCLETASPAVQDTIHMTWPFTDPPVLPPEKNIISQAVSLFRSRTGFNQALKITVEKRIPLGGGLGGGSSDAAAVLLGLNRLASADGPAGLSGAELAEMGASLGSDVSFFLKDMSLAWVCGRGEKIQPLELPEACRGLPLVLVNPGFPSGTAEAYRMLDLWRSGNKERGVLNRCAPQVFEFGAKPGEWPFFNDFLPVVQAVSGTGMVYQQIIGSLRELGADFAGLSGSGSTCFGVFSARDKAELARESLIKRWPFVIITFSLAFRAIQYYNCE